MTQLSHKISRKIDFMASFLQRDNAQALEYIFYLFL